MDEYNKSALIETIMGEEIDEIDNYKTVLTEDNYGLRKALNYDLQRESVKDKKTLDKFRIHYNSLVRHALKLDFIEISLVGSDLLKSTLRNTIGSYFSVFVLFQRVVKVSLINFKVKNTDVCLVKAAMRNKNNLKVVQLKYQSSSKAMNWLRLGHAENLSKAMVAFLPAEVKVQNIPRKKFYRNENERAWGVFNVREFWAYYKFLMAEDKMKFMFLSSAILRHAILPTEEERKVASKLIWTQLMRCKENSLISDVKKNTGWKSYLQAVLYEESKTDSST